MNKVSNCARQSARDTDCVLNLRGAAGWASSLGRPLAVFYSQTSLLAGLFVSEGPPAIILHLDGAKGYALELVQVAVWDSSYGGAIDYAQILHLVTGWAPYLRKIS